ncbi:MAG: YbaB/EbfC family nucleoid-associated protein [candidate division WOR-3 bacterium]
MKLTEMLSCLGTMREEMEQRLRRVRASGSAGGNMVTVTCDGLGEVIEVRIDPAVLAEKDPGLLEDLVRAAVNQAADRAREQARKELCSLAGPLTGLSNLL